MSSNSYQICKSNSLVEASYRLSLAEQRVLLACIAQIRRDQPATDEVFYTVTAKAFAELSGIPGNNSYRDLEEAALRLSRREVCIQDRPNGQGRCDEILITRWVQSIRYRKNSGSVNLRFAKDMLPYLTQLTEQFTQYALDDIARMNSSYAIRLYELLIQWRRTGKREMRVDWLRQALQLDDRYPEIKDFKRRVLNPAIAQINKESPLEVIWTQRKNGRTITHFIFEFHLKEAPPSPPQAAHTPRVSPPQGDRLYGIPRAVIEREARKGESYQEAAARLLREAQTQRECGTTPSPPSQSAPQARAPTAVLASAEAGSVAYVAQEPKTAGA